MRRCTVAATQVDVRHLDVAHNLDTHRSLIAETAEAGCDLVLFPELSTTGHNGSEDVLRDAEPLDGPIVREVAAAASRHGIVVSFGLCELHRGTHFNTCVLVGPDGVLGVQREVHASLDEFLRFRQAYEWSVVDLAFGRVATAICHDSDFFETWRVLALRGAEVVLLPHANRTLAAADGTLTFDGRGVEVAEADVVRAQHELLAPPPGNPRLHDVLARDNGVFAVFSDQVGFDGHTTHVGGAYVLGPDGATLASSSPGVATAWVAAELDPEMLARVRSAPGFPLRKRRPEAYEELTVRS